MQANYTQILERISRASGLAIEEIERKIEAKRSKLSGLVSKEGAAQIVSAELGINFEKQKSKINELEGAKRANITGKVVKLFPVREFKKENREGKVANLLVADETGSVRVVLWDINHINMVEKGEIKEGEVIEIANGGIRNGEIHLTGFSDIKISGEKIDNVKIEKNFSEKRISEAKPGDSVKSRAFIVQSFEPKFFEICPECNGKVISDGDGSVCEKHGRVVAGKRALITIVLDDGSENMRAVLFSEMIDKIGFNLQENLALEREKMLGKEMVFSGTVRQNKFFNSSELFVSSIEEPDLDKLVSELEKNG